MRFKKRIGALVLVVITAIVGYFNRPLVWEHTHAPYGTHTHIVDGDVARDSSQLHIQKNHRVIKPDSIRKKYLDTMRKYKPTLTDL